MRTSPSWAKAKLGVGMEPKTLSRVLKYLESEEIVKRDVRSARPFQCGTR